MVYPSKDKVQLLRDTSKAPDLGYEKWSFLRCCLYQSFGEYINFGVNQIEVVSPCLGACHATQATLIILGKWALR